MTPTAVLYHVLQLKCGLGIIHANFLFCNLSSDPAKCLENVHAVLLAVLLIDLILRRNYYPLVHGIRVYRLLDY